MLFSVPFGAGRWDVLSAFFQRSWGSPDMTRQSLTTAHPFGRSPRSAQRTGPAPSSRGRLYFCNARRQPRHRRADRTTGYRPCTELLPGETTRLPRSRLSGMSDVTRILSAIEQGDPSAAEQLLPLVYD